MHTQPMADSDGNFREYKPCPGVQCRKCNNANVFFRTWESSCGGYEDYNFLCTGCNYEWWVDGVDS